VSNINRTLQEELNKTSDKTSDETLDEEDEMDTSGSR